MIAIINVSKTQKSPKAYSEYELKINHDLLFRFKHQREKGLSDCLYRAYLKALEYEKHKKYSEIKTMCELFNNL